ncbi:MAG: pseudouridylate synthase [Crocinitomicaceae bacterium]|nr:pseudouridylate synthase [Crocinitomicaceae bacterium]
MLEIIYQDDELIAINKPHGLLVHRTKIARDANEFCIQLLRDQIGQVVYPVHRIDRKTSGVLLFALNPEVNTLMQQQFMDRKVGKKYLAFVRGFLPESGTIDYALRRDDGKEQDAVTHYKTLDRVEATFPSGTFPTSRYSLIEVTPETGRMHQIRKHLAHLRHPIIGDRPHGCNKQNKLFLERFNMNTMLLHAYYLEFKHPVTNQTVEIKANIHREFQRVLTLEEVNLNGSHSMQLFRD